MSEIFLDFNNLGDGSCWTQRATIFKENDGKKNIYTVLLEIYGMTPEKEREIILYTKRKALDLANTFLDQERVDFYWSQSIDDFLEKYYN